MEDHVRPIIGWHELLLRLGSAICGKADVGFVYLGASRRFEVQRSTEAWGFVGTDVYAVKDDFAHELLRLSLVSASRERSYIFLHKLRLEEMWAQVLSVPRSALRQVPGGAFVASSDAQLALPRMLYQHETRNVMNHTRVRILERAV